MAITKRKLDDSPEYKGPIDSPRSSKKPDKWFKKATEVDKPYYEFKDEKEKDEKEKDEKEKDEKEKAPSSPNAATTEIYFTLFSIKKFTPVTAKVWATVEKEKKKIITEENPILSPLKELGKKCAAILEQLCLESSHLSIETLLKKPLPEFVSKRKPAISIADYFDRIIKYLDILSEAALLHAFQYLRLLKKKYPTFEFSYLNIHRFLIIAVTVAAKYYDDFYYNNQFCAKVGGIPIEEFNSFEVDFLGALEFDCYVRPSFLPRITEEIEIMYALLPKDSQTNSNTLVPDSKNLVGKKAAVEPKTISSLQEQFIKTSVPGTIPSPPPPDQPKPVSAPPPTPSRTR